MTAIRVGFLSLAVSAIVWAMPAHADYLSVWVAATCDLQSGRAAVRFGYADADDSPLFIRQEKPSLDNGISAVPVTNASQQDASCRLKNGNELLVRLGTGYGEGDQFSVWINGIRIVHETLVDNDLPHEIIIYPDGYRFCRFRLPADDWVYDLTPAAQKPTPIHCDAVSTPISGSIDRVEYPYDPRSKRPEVGSIIVGKAGAAFCRDLIRPAPPNANFKFYVDVPENLGSTVGADEWTDPVYLWPKEHGETAHVEMALFDFWDTGKKVPVYIFESGHTFSTAFAIVPNGSVTKEDVLTVARAAGHFGDIAQAARATGWNVYTAAGTPYDDGEQIGIRLVRINGASYLLYGASRGSQNDPTTVLVKPQRGGKLTAVCDFHEVRAHL